MILDWLVTKNFLRSLFRSLSESFVPNIQKALCAPLVPRAQIERHLTFFQLTLFHYLDDEPLWDVYQSLLPEIFLLGSSIIGDDEDSSSVASKCLNIWSGFLVQSQEDLLVLVKPILCARLQFHMRSVNSWSR